MVMVSVAPAAVALNLGPDPNAATGPAPPKARPTDPLPQPVVASLLGTLPERSGQAEEILTAAVGGARQPRLQGRLLRLIGFVGKVDRSTAAWSDDQGREDPIRPEVY